MTKLTDFGFHGLTKGFASKLSRVGIRSPYSMLKKASKPGQRNSFAKKIGIPARKLTEWVTDADFTRIRGIGGRFACLLQSCGIKNIKQLASRKPEALLKQMEVTNKTKHYVKQLPSQKQVSYWVSRAKSIKKVVNY